MISLHRLRYGADDRMKETKRIKDFLAQRRFAKSATKGDSNEPIAVFSLREKDLDAYETEMYFVNESSEVLKLVTSEPAGMITCDKHVVALGGEGRTYEDVQPGEGVLVDIFHRVYDSDSIVVTSVVVLSEKYGLLDFETHPFKKSVPEMVLLWSNGEKGKEVKLRINNPAIVVNSI